MSSTTDWMADAACKGMDPDLFHLKVVETETRKVCDECPVKAECLEYVLDLPGGQAQGWWAGTAEHDRRALRKQRRRAAA